MSKQLIAIMLKGDDTAIISEAMTSVSPKLFTLTMSESTLHEMFCASESRMRDCFFATMRNAIHGGWVLGWLGYSPRCEDSAKCQD